MQKFKLIYILLPVFMVAVIIFLSVNRIIYTIYEEDKCNDGTYLHVCNIARKHIELHFDDIVAEFIGSYRLHDDIDVQQLSIGHGFKMVNISDDIMDIYQEISSLRDVMVYSNDWLFIINYRNKSRGHIIVRNVNGEYRLYRPELLFSSHFYNYGGLEMSSNLFWHFDEILERYSNDFSVQNIRMFNQGSRFWIINEQYNTIELCLWHTFGAIRRGEPLVMDSRTIAEIIKLDIRYISDVWCQWRDSAYYTLLLELHPLYLAYTRPILFEPVPPLRKYDELNITLEITCIDDLVVAVIMKNNSEFHIFTSLFLL